MRNPMTWHVLLDENEWDVDQKLHKLLQERIRTYPEETGRRPINRPVRTMLVSLCLAVAISAALFIYQQALSGVTQIEAELGAVVELERSATEQSDEATLASLSDSQGWAERARQDFALSVTEDDPTIAVEVENVKLRDNLALVEVLVQDSRLPLAWREVRFYRETPGGWLRTAPQPVFWGSQYSLQSEYFLFHYRLADSLAVAEAAPRLDANYARIRSLLALPVDSRQAPLVVDVRVLNLPTQNSVESYTDGTFVATSPLLLPRPAGFSAADMLVEGISVSLIDRNVDRVAAHLPASWMLSGGSLRLWLAWELDTHLGHWQNELLDWAMIRERRLLYAQAVHDHAASIAATQEYQEMCQSLQALGLSHYDLGIPISCVIELPIVPNAYGMEYMNRWNPLVGLEAQLRQIGPDIDAKEHLGAWSIDLALLFAYANAMFGEEAVPRLLKLSSDNYHWNTLIPTAFAISSEEFEAGWQLYVHEIQ